MTASAASQNDPVTVNDVETSIDQITYTIKVYETSSSKGSGEAPLFDFKTDSEGKYFPTAELADGNYLPKLRGDYTSSSAYYSNSIYDNGNYIDMKNGDVFWGFVNEIAKQEGDEFSIDNLNVYLFKPSITLNIIRTNLDYKFFSDGKITADENEYVSEHSTAGDVWRVSHGNSTFKYEYVSGDSLANFVWSASVDDYDDSIALDLINKIYFVNKIGNSLELIGPEDSDANGTFRNVIKENISTYEFTTAPISIETAAQNIGIITRYQTPVEWTVYGTKFWGNDDAYAYMADEHKNNIELNSAKQFNFDNNERPYLPIVMISKAELKEFEIPCAEATDGKLVYTYDDH